MADHPGYNVRGDIRSPESDLQTQLSLILSGQASFSAVLKMLAVIASEKENEARKLDCAKGVGTWSRRSLTVRRAVAEIDAQDVEAEKAAALNARLDELANGDWTELVAALIPDIEDDYRATDDPDDDQPGMCLTVGTDDEAESWGYQTGDNSYTGGAYGSPHWAVVYLSRDSVPSDVAGEIADQLADLILQ